ncbi:MAG: hypothetical protein R6U98_17685, partial [Pirellulaceae bacterium]
PMCSVICASIQVAHSSAVALSVGTSSAVVSPTHPLLSVIGIGRRFLELPPRMRVATRTLDSPLRRYRNRFKPMPTVAQQVSLIVREAEATACLEALRERFAKFGLRLNEGKTRLIEFGRYAIERRRARGAGRPETFDFRGFTHKCAKTRTHGRFTVHRHSMAKRMRATLQAIKLQLRKRMHRGLGETARWLRRVVQGWLNYHTVRNNSHWIGRFVDEVTRLWLRTLRRRSQRGRSG